MNRYKVFYRKPNRPETFILIDANSAREAEARVNEDMEVIVTGCVCIR